MIGNGDYPNGRLRNPTNDARGLARVLRGLGFEVLAHENLSQRDMRRAINDFGRRLRDGGVGLFYYAGHGLQVNGRNYLVPVDATIDDESEVEVEAVDVATVLGRMEAARNRLNVVILDACRDNPYARSFRNVSRGLASIDAPAGTVLAYATAPGRVARDGEGMNGLYTGELLKAMVVPGLKIEDVFKRVRQGVQEQSRGEQVPWESVSIVGDFVFALPSGPAAAAAPAGPLTLAGSWRGDMLQPDAAKGSYPMILTIVETRGTLSGAVHYPTLQCSGWLELLERREAAVIFRELIEQGVERCVNGGTVEIRLTSSGSAQIVWFYPEGMMGATAVLRRAD